MWAVADITRTTRADEALTANGADSSLGPASSAPATERSRAARAPATRSVWRSESESARGRVNAPDSVSEVKAPMPKRGSCADRRAETTRPSASTSMRPSELANDASATRIRPCRGASSRSAGFRSRRRRSRKRRVHERARRSHRSAGAGCDESAPGLDATCDVRPEEVHNYRRGEREQLLEPVGGRTAGEVAEERMPSQRAGHRRASRALHLSAGCPRAP